MAKQIRSKEVVSRILEDDDDFDYYDLIESKIDRPNKKGAAAGGKTPAGGTGEATDPRVLKENELMKRRNEHLLQILMEFENENKLMEKGLLEIDEQIKKLNAANVKGSKGARYVKDNVIKCPSLEKLLSVRNSFVIFTFSTQEMDLKKCCFLVEFNRKSRHIARCAPT